MARVRRYAEGTTVAVETTQDEMRRLLRTHGATEFGLYEGPGRQAVQFTMDGMHYRFEVDMPSQDWAKGQVHLRTWDYRFEAAVQNKVDAEWRRRWRARLMWLKTTLEFAAGEDSAELVNVLGAFAVLENGQTLGRALYAGQLPLLTG